MSRYKILARKLPDGAPQTVVGRDAWALEQLLAAGEKGCTPIDRPAPRWSHYIYKLRSVHGFIIETIEESHAGTFAGSHGRYVLRSRVEILPADAAKEAA